MILVERKRDAGIVEISKIDSIDGLENHQVVKMERGDKIKKTIKGARSLHEDKNCYSVKSIKEAQAIYVNKQNKKTKSSGGLCCVCSDYSSNLDENGVCSHCQIG